MSWPIIRTTAVVPCLNEEKNIFNFVHQLQCYVDEVIVVDNGSTDHTAELARSAGARVIFEPRKQSGIGYGYAHRAGLNAAHGEYIIAIDADGEYPVEFIPRLVQVAEFKNYDFVVACRKTIAQKRLNYRIRRFGNWILGVTASLFFHRRFNDILSGMWLVRQEARQYLNLEEGGWNLSPEIKIKAAQNPHIRFGEVEIEADIRTNGESKQVLWKTGLQHLVYLFLSRLNALNLNGTYILQGVAIGLMLLGMGGVLYSLVPVVNSELGYEISNRLADKTIAAAEETAPAEISFANLISQVPPMRVTPVNTTNSIVIEKLGVNTPLVWDVDVATPGIYLNALNRGVAHAAGTQRPQNRNGNTYFFAHSTLNPFEIEKYSASFTLLHRLEKGDSITVFNDGYRFDYVVQTKEVVGGFNTEPLTRQPGYPMLTLQTCDPPGVPLNRLIITGRLVATYSIN